MSRNSVLLLATTTLLVLLVPAVPAAAGGGCHSGVTNGSGDTVEMVDACFTPTTLRVDPGASVTFVNQDDFTHNVVANTWGHYDDMNQGDAFTATFAEEGIYAYACNYHPGMTGAIVVGDGEGAGNGETVNVASFEQPAPPSPVVEIRTVRTPSEGGSDTLGWLLGGAIGLAVGLGVGAAAFRRRGTTLA